MWYNNSVFYEIYMFGLCGALDAPRDSEPRIRTVLNYVPHLKKLGVSAVWLCPLFECDYHGYDTTDYRKLDARLGTNEDFRDVVRELHNNGIRVILDGVFNHVGRNFGPFQDVRKNRESSPYAGWFHIDFSGNTPYNDGFYYEGWEGHFELVKLNLDNPEVRQYLFGCIQSWVEEYDIDGLRLDVAYLLPDVFLTELRSFSDNLKPDFFLVGEIIGGDYSRLLGPGKLHSCTNYECRKGLYSSFENMNLCEIGYSLNRQFGNEDWCLYRGQHLLSFVDNHDVDRAASVLTNKEQLAPLYGLLFGMPGIPCLYYGSEWGAEGRRANDSDRALRPWFAAPEWNALTDAVAGFARARRGSGALCSGSYRQLLLTNRQLIFERRTDLERVIVAVNADGTAFHADFNAGCGCADDMVTGCLHDFGGGSTLPPYSTSFWKCEK